MNTYAIKHRRRLDHTVRLAARIASASASVLDIGPHVLTQRLRQVFGRVDSLGFDTECLDLRPGEKHTEHDLNLMPWPKMELYDLVCCCEVAEHLRLPLPLMLAGLAELVKPHGSILLTVPNAAALKNRLKLARGQQPFPLKPLAENGDWGHWREPTRAEVEAAAKSSGLAVREFEAKSDIGHAGVFGRLYNWLAGVLPAALKDRLVFVLRTPLSFFVCLACFAGLSASAAVYFVDGAQGSDAAAGTSASVPWKCCPGDTNATGVAASATLAPGDTVIFKGGVPYTNIVIVPWSGTLGNPITYDGNSAGTFGSGPAAIDEGYLKSYGFICVGRSNLNFQGFTIEHCGGVPISTYGNYGYPSPALPAIKGYGLYMVDAAQVTVANCLFKEMAYWENVLPVNTDITGLGGWGVLNYSGVNITITNCEFTRMAYAVHIIQGPPASGLLSSNTLVTTCNIHNYINWGVVVGPMDNSIITNLCITNCTLHDMPEYGSLWAGGGDGPHVDPIFMGNGAAHHAVATNIVVCNNTFYENGSAGGMTAWIFLTTMIGDVTVRNNTLKNTHAQYGLVYVQDACFAANGNTPINFKILNNSAYGDYILCGFRWSSPANGDDPTASVVRVLNNIWYMTNGNTYVTPVLLEGTTHPLTQCDYNLWYVIQPNGYHDIFASTAFPAWQALGYDAHGLYGDPKWANLSYGLESANSSLNDLHLTASSPAVGSGTNLSAIFNTDLDGRQRGAVWDIGPYVAPQSLTLTINGQVVTSGNVTITITMPH